MKFEDFIGGKVIDYVESHLGSKRGLVIEKEGKMYLINFKNILFDCYELQLRKGLTQQKKID